MKCYSAVLSAIVAVGCLFACSPNEVKGAVSEDVGVVRVLNNQDADVVLINGDTTETSSEDSWRNHSPNNNEAADADSNEEVLNDYQPSNALNEASEDDSRSANGLESETINSDRTEEGLSLQKQAVASGFDTELNVMQNTEKAEQHRVQNEAAGLQSINHDVAEDKTLTSNEESMGTTVIQKPDDTIINSDYEAVRDYPNGIYVYTGIADSGELNLSTLKRSGQIDYGQTAQYFSVVNDGTNEWYGLGDNRWIPAEVDGQYLCDMVYFMSDNHFEEQDIPSQDPVINTDPIDPNTELNIGDDTLSGPLDDQLEVTEDYFFVVQSDDADVPVWTSLTVNPDTGVLVAILSEYRAKTGYTYRVHKITPTMVDIGENQWIFIDPNFNDAMEAVSVSSSGTNEVPLDEVASSGDLRQVQDAPTGLYTHVKANASIFDGPEGELIALAYESVNEHVLQTAYNLQWLGLANGRWVPLDSSVGASTSNDAWQLAALAKPYQAPGAEGKTPSQFAETIDSEAYSKIINRIVAVPSSTNVFITTPTLVWSSIGPTGHVTGQILEPGDEYLITSMFVDNYGDTWFELAENRWMYANDLPVYFDKRMLKIDGSNRVKCFSQGNYIERKRWSFINPWVYTVTNGNYATHTVSAERTTVSPYMISPGTEVNIVGAQSTNGYVFLETSEGYWISINGEYSMAGKGFYSSVLNDSVGEAAEQNTDFSLLSAFDVTKAPDEFYFWVSPALWGTATFSLPSYSKGNEYYYRLNAGDIFKVKRIANTKGEASIWYEIADNVWVPSEGAGPYMWVPSSLDFENLNERPLSVSVVSMTDDVDFYPVHYDFVVTDAFDKVSTWTNYGVYSGSKTIAGGSQVHVVEIRYTDDGIVWYKLDDGSWLNEYGHTLTFTQSMAIGTSGATAVIESVQVLTATFTKIASIFQDMNDAITEINGAMDALITAIDSINQTVDDMTIAVDKLNITVAGINNAVKDMVVGMNQSLIAVDETHTGMNATVAAVNGMNSAIQLMIAGTNTAKAGITAMNNGIAEVSKGMEEAVNSIEASNKSVETILAQQKELKQAIISSIDVESYTATMLSSADLGFNNNLGYFLSHLNLDLTNVNTSKYATTDDLDLTIDEESVAIFTRYVGSSLMLGKGVYDMIVGVMGIIGGSGGDVVLSISSGGFLTVPATEMAIAIDTASAVQIAGGAGEIAGAVVALSKAKGYSDDGAYRSSQTIGGTVEARDGSRKRVLRVDYEPMSNKIQIQDNTDKLFDERISYSLIKDEVANGISIEDAIVQQLPGFIKKMAPSAKRLFLES